MAVQYLEKTIVDAKRTDTPRYGMAADGYTLRSGAPTSYMIKLENEKRWRRLMCWQFSNAGTCFVRVNKIPLVIRYETDIQILADRHHNKEGIAQ